MATPESTAVAVPENLHVFSESGSTYVDLVAKGCSGKRYRLDPDHPKYVTIISILMAAQISGHKVSIRFDGYNDQNQGNIIGVYLK